MLLVQNTNFPASDVSPLPPGLPPTSGRGESTDGRVGDRSEPTGQNHLDTVWTISFVSSGPDDIFLFSVSPLSSLPSIETVLSTQ